MNPRIKALSAEFDRLKAGIKTIHDRAEAEHRDLTTDEQTQADELYNRAEVIRPEIEAEAAKSRSFTATAEILAGLGLEPKSTDDKRRSTNEPAAPQMTPGEYLVLYNRASRGDTDAGELLRSFHDRAAQQQALADNQGVVPDLLIGDLVKFVDAQRYTINSLGTKPMFRGNGRRPRVTQSTLIAAQATEFTEMSSRKMLITRDNLTRGTYGGYVEISEQDDEFSDPAMMQILLQDLAEQYAFITNDIVADALVAAATNTFELTGAAGAISTITNTNLNKGLWAAAGQVYTQCKQLPDTIWASVDIWQDFGGRVDTTERPLFPTLGPTNAAGTMEGVGSFGGRPVNLNFVVDPSFAAGTLIVGAKKYGEVYEQNKGLARGAFKPGTLSTEVGYRGYLATYFRAEGFVRVVNAA